MALVLFARIALILDCNIGECEKMVIHAKFSTWHRPRLLQHIPLFTAASSAQISRYIFSKSAVFMFIQALKYLHTLEQQ